MCHSMEDDMTPQQLKMLISFADDGEATDYSEFHDTNETLGWQNRERVIDALRRKGFLDDDGITKAGLIAIGRR